MAPLINRLVTCDWWVIKRCINRKVRREHIQAGVTLPTKATQSYMRARKAPEQKLVQQTKAGTFAPRAHSQRSITLD